MEQPEITVYGAPWCPDCRQSKQFLGEQRIRFNWVNIDDDEEGRNKVQELNDVKQIIPTIVFEDGSILVEPSNADLAAKLGINHKAKRAKAIERSLSASATVGPCLEFNSPLGALSLLASGFFTQTKKNDQQSTLKWP
jgi:glutaredoxin